HKAEFGAVRDRLLALLCDRDRQVQSAAAEAVGLLGKESATEAVLERLVGLLEDRHIRPTAAGALATLVARNGIRVFVKPDPSQGRARTFARTIADLSALKTDGASRCRTWV